MARGGSSSGSFSVLGADVTITGNISASTELHIDGTVEGDIDCASLVQGDGSQITGEVKAETARLLAIDRKTLYRKIDAMEEDEGLS